MFACMVGSMYVVKHLEEEISDIFFADHTVKTYP